MSQPAMLARCRNTPEPAPGPDSLLDISVRAVIAGRRILAPRIAHTAMPAEVLRAVLAKCGRAELTAIEDSMMSGGGAAAHDILWHTWDFWQPIYRFACSGAEPALGELIPLPGQPPCDYLPPRGVREPPAHYRAMLEAREAAAAARTQAALARLRSSYASHATKRHEQGVEYTTKLPPAKKARGGGSEAAAAAAGRTLGGKPATTVLRNLGLGSSSSKSSSSSSRGPNRAAPSRPAGKVQLLSPGAAAAARGTSGGKLAAAGGRAVLLLPKKRPAAAAAAAPGRTGSSHARPAAAAAAGGGGRAATGQQRTAAAAAGPSLARASGGLVLDTPLDIGGRR